MFANAGQEGDYLFESDGAGVAITGYIGLGGGVILPDHLNDQPVTRIAYEAFAHLKTLTAVTLSVGVTEVESHAFLDCARLTTIDVDILNLDYSSQAGVLFDKASRVLFLCPPGKEGTYDVPSGVLTLAGSAFQGCQGLRQVTLPRSVTSIEGIGFSDCGVLGSLSVDELNSAYSSAEGLLFNKQKTQLLTCPQGKLGAIEMPNSVIEIAELAFFGCRGVTSVALSKGLTGIGNSAFAQCLGLSSLIVPKGVTGIGFGAFQGCSLLKSVYFEGDAPEVGVLFDGPAVATVYYTVESKGWGDFFADQPTAIWSRVPNYAAWVLSSGLGAKYPNATGETDDPDGDGLVNRGEWVAGTDPTEADSVLVLELVPRPADLADADRSSVPEGFHALYFRSVPGRRYGANVSPVLGGAWQQQAIAVASTTQTRFLVPKPASQGFYRVVVLP